MIFAREQLHFSPSLVGSIIFWGYAGGAAGNYVAGYLVERVGRRPTVSILYAFSAVAICMLYQAHSESGQYLWMILTVFGFGAANTATHIYASELFPTAIRATGYGWTTNLFGRVAEIATPALIGLMIQQLGVSISTAVAVVSVGPLVGAALVWRFAPETRGLTLEQVERVAERKAPSVLISERQVEGAAPEPGDHGQLEPRHAAGDGRGLLHVRDQERQRLDEAAGARHRAADDAADPRSRAAGEASVVGAGFDGGPSEAGDEARRETDEEGREGVPGDERRREQWRQRREGALSEPLESRLQHL